MREIEKVIETEKIYIANDGRKFDNEYLCRIYETYAPKTIYDVLKDYIKADEQVLNKLKGNEFPAFSYIVILKNIPKEIRSYINIIEKKSNSSGCPNTDYINFPCLFYNNWSNAYSGSYGRNGWIKVGTKEDLQNEKELIEKTLKYFE